MDSNTSTSPESTLEEDMAAVMAELPAPVRNFLSSPERDRTIRDLTGKYQLHVDQGGVFAKSFLLMLLGISSPDEFVASLRDAGIAEAVVAGLTADINERVFTKLRAQEMNSSVSLADAPTAPAARPAPATAPMQAVPTARELPPPANLPGAGVADPNIGMPPPAAPAPMSAPEQLVRYTPPQPIQKGDTFPSQGVTLGTPQPAPTQPPPAQPAQSPRPIIKEYASDPYHEPIE
jgi:hypothetical protein